METTQVYGMPRIGDAAPEFKAVTTQGDINFPSDYKGKWAILFGSVPKSVSEGLQFQ